MIEKNEPRFIIFYYNVAVVSNKGSSFCFVYFVMFVGLPMSCENTVPRATQYRFFQNVFKYSYFLCAAEKVKLNYAIQYSEF